MKGGPSILIVLIAVVALSTGVAAGYPYLQAKIVPILVGVAILLLSVVELIRELRGSRNSAPAMKLVAEDEEEKKEEIKPRSFIPEGCWMVGFFLMICLVGFIAGIGLFTALYAGTRRTKWPVAVGLGLFMAVISYALFSYVTDTELYPGIVARYLGLAG